MVANPEPSEVWSLMRTLHLDDDVAVDDVLQTLATTIPDASETEEHAVVSIGHTPSNSRPSSEVPDLHPPVSMEEGYANKCFTNKVAPISQVCSRWSFSL